MAIKYYERYPQRWESPSQDYPQGAFKNLSALGEQDGSYLEKDWLNDYSGFFGALLRNAEMTPDGTVDTAQRSQFYDALIKVAKESVSEEGYRKLDDNIFNGYLQVRSEQGTGVSLQDTDGTVRGQVVANDQGLQLTQYPKDGGLQTFTFPSEGGELVVDSTLGYVTPEMFGAKGDGSTDDSEAIQLCLDSGKTVVLSAKKYIITKTLYVNIAGTHIKGSGQGDHTGGGTTLTFRNITGDGIVFISNRCNMSDLSIQAIHFKAGTSTVKVGGNVTNVTLEGVRISDPVIGINVFGSNTTRLRNIVIVDVREVGVMFTGNADNKSDILDINTLNIGGTKSKNGIGVLWDGYAHTLTLNTVRAISVKQGLVVQNTLGDINKKPAFLFSNGLEIDFPEDEGILLDVGVDAYLSNTYVHGSRKSSNIRINNSFDRVSFSNSRITGAAMDGVISSSPYFIFNSGFILNNSQAEDGAYSGISLLSGDWFSISNVVVGGSKHKHGISTNYDYGTISDVDVRENHGNTPINYNLKTHNVNGVVGGSNTNILANSTYRVRLGNARGTHMEIGGLSEPKVNLRVASSDSVLLLAESNSLNDVDMVLRTKGEGTLQIPNIPQYSTGLPQFSVYHEEGILKIKL